MEVFISWSGDRSRKVAAALREWLPSVIQSIEPFMSESDIDKGSRWSDELAGHLGHAEFGLICLTQENLGAPWLLFEAGALSRSIGTSRVVPFLYGVPQAELQGPLAQFQAALATKDSTLHVVKSINQASGESGLDATRLEDGFETWWPRLESTLRNIPEPVERSSPPRPDREILEEILHLCRQTSRQRTSEQETRNLAAHMFHADSVDSNDDLGVDNRKSPMRTTVADVILRYLAQQAGQRRLERDSEISSDDN